MRAIAIFAAAAAISAGAAAAQSAATDTALSYRGGVVSDDDLVPGRGVDQPYLVDEQGGGGSGDALIAPPYGAAAGRGRLDPPQRRANSPNLIGRDGRAIGY